MQFKYASVSRPLVCIGLARDMSACQIKRISLNNSTDIGLSLKNWPMMAVVDVNAFQASRSHTENKAFFVHSTK